MEWLRICVCCQCIYFCGSEQEWSRIKIKSRKPIIYHCSYAMAAVSLDLRVILCWIRAVSSLEPQFYRACLYSPVFFPTTPSQLRLSHPWNLLGHHNLLLNKGVNWSGLMQCVSHQEHNHSRRLMHTNEIPTLTFSSHSVEDPCNWNDFSPPGKFVCSEQNTEYLWNSRGFSKVNQLQNCLKKQNIIGQLERIPGEHHWHCNSALRAEEN